MKKKVGVLGLAALMIFLLGSSANAYQIKRVVHGSSGALDSATEVASVDISGSLGIGGVTIPVDMTKSFVYATNSINHTYRVRGNVLTLLDDGTHLLLDRFQSGTATTVDWNVVEFVSGVTVISGMTTISEMATSKTIMLPQNFQADRAFPIISAKAYNSKTNNADDEPNIFKAQLSAPNQLILTRIRGGSKYNEDIGYQVVIFDPADPDVKVQSGTASISNGASTANVTLGTSVDAAKSFLVFSATPNNSANAGVASQYAVDGQIASSGTTITFTRQDTSSTSVDIVWYVTSFNQAPASSREVYAQQGRSSSFTGTTSTQSITSTLADRTFFFTSCSGASGSGATGDDETWVRSQFGNSTGATTTLVYTRETSETTPCYMAYSVVELPSISVTSPVGVAGTADSDYANATKWTIGGNGTITWKYADTLKTGGSGSTWNTSYQVHKIKIELSVDGGTTWLQIPGASSLDIDDVSRLSGATPTTDNTYSFTWNNIPTSISGTNLLNYYGTEPKSKYKIKITDLDSSSHNFDISNGYFIIVPSLTVTQPQGTPWNVGDKPTLSWSQAGNLTGRTLKFELAADGTTFDHIITQSISGADVSGGSTTWDESSRGIPSVVATGTKNPIGATNKVRITLVGTNPPPHYAISSDSSSFSIRGRIYDVTPTADDETWLLGETHAISWKKYGYLDNGTSDNNGRVKIYYAYDVNTDGSGGTYMEIYNIVSQVHQNVGDLNAGTDTDGSSSSGSYNWTIPIDLPTTLTGKVSRVKVVQSVAYDPSIYAISTKNITVLGSLTINAPTGGEVWRYGTTHAVQWTPHGTMPYVVIKYKVGAGSWNYMVGAAPTDNLPAGNPEVMQSFQWNIPDALGTNNVVIRVCNKDNENIYAEASPISIKGNFIVTQPDGLTSVMVTNATANNRQTIAWTAQGSMAGNVVIRLSQNGGTSWNDPAIATVPITPSSYQWTVTGAQQGTDCKIKVGLEGDEDAVTGNAGTSASFKVVPYLVLTYPNAPQLTYSIGDTVYIKWTPDPQDFGTVDLRYDTNSGANGYTGFIVNAVASNNVPNGETEIGYKWTIPDVAGIVGDKLRVKVYQTGKPNDVYATSSYDFKVMGSLSVTGEANGGAYTWKIGQNKSITWNVTGDVGDVNIMYSLDGGQTYLNYVKDAGGTTVVVPCTATGSYSYAWAIPDDAIGNVDRNTQVRFKVVTTSGLLSATAAADLTIQGQLILTQPLGGDTLYAQDTDNPADVYHIAWNTYGQISQVKLYYDINSGGDGYDKVIAGGIAIANLDGYDWAVPAAIGTTIRVKVMSSVSGTQIYTTSTTDFEIKGKIRVVSPTSANTGANALKIHTAQLPSPFLIEWKNFGDLGTTNIYYSDNNGAEYLLVTTASGANGPQNYSWNPPATWGGRNTIGADNRIKVTDSNDETYVFSESQSFEIKGQLKISEPNGGEVYNVGGTPIDITWDKAGDLGNIDIFFSSDGGASYGTVIATIDSGVAQPYQIAVPSQVTTQGKIKLEQVSDRTGVVTVTANPGFAIKGNVIITFPDNNPALSVNVDTDLTVTWTIVGAIQNVAIDYDKTSGTGGYLGSVVGSTPAAAGSYAWHIPANDSAVSDNVRIRVRDFNDGTVKDESAADFKIKPTLAVSSPAGGEAWIVGELKPITWAPLGFTVGDLVKLQYSDDGGVTWPTGAPYEISEVSVASLTYNWSIPDNILSSQCVVRVSKVGDSTVKADTPWFTIKGSLNITQPDGNINMPINTTYTIKWDKVGAVGNVALYYSVDAPHASWTAIAGAGSLPAAQGTTGFDWTVPDAPSATVKVKAVPVTAGDPTSENASDLENAIVGSIFLQTPNPTSGDTMVVGNNYNITWTKFGAIASFDVYYSYDNKATWNQIGNDVVSLNLSWPVEDHISTQVHFRVVDATNPSVSSETTAASTIKGSIDLTSPDGANTLTVGTPFDITWAKTGSIGNIKIEYSTDDFAGDVRTINASYSGSSPYPWSPGITDITNADTVKVRVTSIGGIPVTDKSANAFKIVGGISNVQPSGSTNIWHKAETKTISWNETGNIPAVDILYKTAVGDSFNKTIVLNNTGHADGTNTFDCTVPDENSEDCWIQVLDHANSSVKAQSAQAFSIRPVISVSAPVVGSNIKVGSNNTNAIVWNLNGSTKVNTVDILYSTAGIGGPFNKTIATGVNASLGQFDWNGVANDISSNVVVKVVDSLNANTYGLSAVFNIVGQITVQQPNGGEDWVVGSTSHNITWTKQGTIGNVNIYVDYGSGYGVSIATVDSETATLYNWNPIPDQISNTVKVKVACASNPNVYDESDAVFHVIGGFAISLPDGSPLTSGDPYTITWVPTGAGVSKVKIEFYDGTGWTTLAEQATNSGTYGWTVPLTTSSTQCKIRLTASVPDQPATATESGSFWVHGKVDVTAPTSSAQWTVGTPQDIAFGITGKIDTVNIKYSVDGGADNYAYAIVSGLAVSQGANTYQWNIPVNQPILSASGAKIKVVDSAYATVYGVSQNFMVKGTLSALTPSADNIIMTYSGISTYNITWSVTGPISDVRIYYSTNDGATYPNEITTSAGVPATPASYAWDIPNQIVGKHMKIRVVDKNNAATFGESANTFEIIGQIALGSPAGGEKWIVASTQAIKWTPTGTYTNVQVQASIDDFASYILNVTRPAGVSGVEQTYNWVNLPDNLSNTVKVRVYDPDHQPTLVRDTSENFTILGGVNVTGPANGIVWYKGETKNITWDTTGTVTNVKIEYKTTVGGAYTTIVANDPNHNTPGANSYTWTAVADENSETCYVRVSDVNNYTDVYSVSATPFSIRPQVNVTAPVLGAVVRVGSNNANAVQWNFNASQKVSYVNIVYSINGIAGPFDKTIATNVDATLGQSNWNGVANDVSTNVVVKVVDTTNANVSGLSPVFTIAGTITLTSPNGANNWPVGSSQNITWTKTGTIGNVNIYADYGAGYGGTPIATVDAEATSLYAWNPIPDQVTNSAKIKVASADNPSVIFDESDAAFAIAASFAITAPGNGEVLTVGNSYDVTWTRLGSAVTNVKLEYSANGGVDWTTITASTVNSGTYPWNVADAISTSCKLRISDPNNPNANAESAGYFKIKGSVTVTSPNLGSESWSAGSTYPITWTKTGSIASVNVYYSHDNGTTWTKINTTAVDASLGTWNWYIDEATPLTTQGLIRIVDASDSTVYDLSNNNFEVKGAVYLQTPSGAGLSMRVNDLYNITWTVFGAIQNVELHFSTNGGIAGGGAYLEGDLITTIAASALTFAWTVPDRIGNNVRVRVRDAANNAIWSESANAFRIRGAVTVATPNGGEIWPVGSTQHITWTKDGTFANVKLEYSTNGFSDELQTVVIIAATNAAALDYAWTVADAISNTVKVRITDANNSEVVDVSDGNFFIKGSLSLLAPNGAEEWTVGNSQNIVWARTGSIANVKLEYSTDGGATFPGLVIASTPAAAGSYPWVVSDAIGIQTRVRVSDVSDASVSDTSNANFTIKGALVLTAPNGAEAWPVGSSHNITWTKSGSIATVKLEYSTDGGTTYPNTIIASTDAATGSYAWSIPDNTTPIAKVRISSTADANVYDISDANFKIIGSLTLTSPDGNEGWLVGTGHNISWAMVGNIANVKLEYSTNAGASYDYQIIASTPGGALGYFWASIPDTVSTQVKVRISDATDATVNDVSNAVFKIQAGFTVTAPDGGEVWTVGSAENITWSKVGTSPSVKLEYSTNGGLDYDKTINASTSNTGTYSWTIPDTISASCRVKVSDANDASAFDASNGNFKIRGALNISSPNGAEIWTVGSSHNVTWSRTGSIATAILQYSTDGGTTYPGLINASVDASAGTYAWTVPDAISGTCRVRIADNSDGTVEDVSNNNFAIKGSVTLTAPNGGDEWVVGTGRNITWNKTGSIANVKLEYSTDSGGSYPYTIVGSTGAAAGSYSWNIPDVLSSTVRVRVSDASDATVSDESNADFMIKGSLTLVSPNGGELWTVGESRNVTWNRTGSIANVKLEYSTDAGVTFPFLIVGATNAALGTYNWTVPDAISGSLRVRITDVNNALVSDASDANFVIKGTLVLNTPNGAEVWAVGSTQNITWARTGSIANVKLEYSTDGGSSYAYTITASTPAAAGTYPWLIPDAIGLQARVRVSDAADAAVGDTSDGNFAIRGALVITAPNGGEQWGVSTSQNITWTRNGSIATVKLEYSLDGGTSYPNVIIASTDAATGSYPWTIPDAINSTVKVKITSTADTAVTDVSDLTFKIVGVLTLTSPNGAEKWGVGTARNVTWTMSGSVSNLRIDYSTNSGASYPNNVIASTPASALTYLWTIPDAVSNLIRVKISDAADISVYDASNADFSIQARFDVTSPDGGEVWVVGSSHDIAWNRTGSTPNVKIEYSTDSGQNYTETIIASTPNTGSYPWVVPDAISSSVRVRVSDVNDADAYDSSLANFKIRGGITVTAPNGNEAWIVATAYNIAWTKVGSIANVKIEYSTDSGASYPNLILGSIAADAGLYSWTIPDNLTFSGRVKITDTTDSSVYDESNADFKIRGALALSGPNGNEEWNVASVHDVTWTRTGSIPTVKLEYSTDGGTTYPAIIVASTDASTGTYPWTVPDAITNLGRVRVSYTADATVFDTSNANFKIKGVLALLSPIGTEFWEVAEVKNITWQVTGSITNVKLEYSTDSGATYPNLITGSTPAATGSYAWTIPDNLTTQARVKISNVTDATVSDVSDADFKIAGKLTLVAPNGGEVWPVGTAQSITWVRGGSIAAIKIELSQDGGVTYPTLLVASTPAGDLNYPWTVPDIISSTLRIKITNLADSAVYDACDANFKIRGNLTLTSPVGNEIWLINSSHSITWTKFGSITNARLDYSTDGGTTYPFNIVASIDASLQTYNWVVPDNPSIQVRVKISVAGDASVYSTSAANFTIRGGFTILTPNGNEDWAVGSTQNITWTTFGSIANVKLLYSVNNGSNWYVITGSVVNTGTYGWTIPDNISQQCLVQIVDVNDPNALDISDAIFKIHGALSLTSPNGNEEWAVSSSQNILWTRNGSIANVKLEYSIDGGASYPNVIVGQTPGAALTYAWTIPDSISTQVKVKITDASDATVFDTSDSVFKIKGSFLISSPNGGENWVVASSHNVTWSTFGTVANVKLEYSTDAGSSWTLMNASYANSGTYNWTVPDAISTQARVRVSDSNDSTASDASDNNFKIRGDLQLTAPNGGETWKVGTNQVITWARTGSIANVRLEYSDNGGATYVPITNSTPNTGTYSWTIPDAITTQARVRISNVDDITVTDASDANFKIQGTLTVSSPNGGEAWIVGSTHDITWTTGGTINFVNLDYSTDSGATFPVPNTIATNLGNVGTYSWTVPDSVSGSVRVRVRDASDAESYDTSNADFRIRTTIILTSPVGGEVTRVGYPYNVTWTTIGNIPNVKIEYSRYNFLMDINTVADATANDGSYAWTIPDTISNTVKVRISDPNDAGAQAVSASDFRIITGLTVTAPNGNEKWDVASAHDITWTCTSAQANVPQVKIEYSVDGGASFPYIIAATANTGTYAWDPVPDTISANVKVKISDLADSTAYDVSDNPAKIRAKFTLGSPNGAEIWTVADQHDITWTTVGTVANVKLDYSTNDFASSAAITASTANTGTYAWTIPDAISTNVKVRVMSTTDVDAYDLSDAAFKIRGALLITAPNGGELWLINQASNITWGTTGTIANVRIMYSTDSGSTFTKTVIASTPNNNAYAWLLPDDATPNARVRVIDAADATVYDDSDANFRIRGYYTITSPNGGEAWVVGTPHNVTWVKGGTIGYKLLYSTDSGSTYPNTIVTNSNPAQNNGTYTWTIPDDLSLTARVRIEDSNDSLTNDESNADFQIRGALTVTAPNGNERWVTNETRNITWVTNAGSIQNVKIDYSTDSGATFPNAVIASSPNTGSYAWVIPDNRSTTARVRVADAANTAVADVSDANFRIDYYTITWILRDLLTNEPLTNLSVTEKITATTDIHWQQAGLTSPVTHDTPYGSWTTTWSSSGYGDKAQNFDFTDGKTDQTFTLYLETSAVHIWRAYSDFAYTASTDTLEVTSWLERDGIVVTGAASVTVEIYDGAVLIKTMNSNILNAGGFFNMTWENTGLVEGKVYAVITDLVNASGAHFKTPGSFSVTEAKRLQETQQAVEDMRDVTLPAFQSSVSNLITTKLDDQADLITDKMEEQKDIIVDKTNEMVNSVNTTLTSFETKSDVAIKKLQSGADQAVAAGEELEATAKRYSWKATVSPDPALTGDLLTFSCQGPSGFQPLISIYNYDNKIIALDRPMIETTAGLYVYEITAGGDKFTAGKAYTYVISEQVTGGMVTGSGMVETTSITTIAGLAAAAPEAERAAKKVLDAVTALQNVLVSENPINIGLALTNLQKSVEDLPQQIAQAGGNGSAQAKVLNDVAEKLKALVGDEGIDITDMIQQALGENPTIKEIRGKTDAIQGVIKFLQQLFEAKFGGLDMPIVSTSLAAGSVKFRIMAANPSKIKTQKVPVKIYLPAEVKPKDVMDLGGMTLEYDQEKSIYYVYATDVELAPLESRVFEVEVEDIWFVPQSDIDALRNQAMLSADRLKKTDYAQAASDIATSISARLDDIVRTQNDEMMSREQHIGQYRANVQMVAAIKEDLARLEKMLVAVGAPMEPTMLEKVKMKGEAPTHKLTWIVIFVIIIFIGLLAAVFFFTWNSQVRASESLIAASRKEAFGHKAGLPPEGREEKKE